ncbi:MAG: type II secretion system protein N [Oleispira antarctica]|nr:type II secretion system protein N [Oleispira antarctica]MBQ0793888.1 type II secretion system protein N [Oleispira antarctica]
MSAIWSAKWYLLIGLFSFIIFLGMTAPLAFIWPKVQPHLGRLPVQVELVSGTLWQGQARVNIPNVGKVTGKWDIQLSELLAGQLAANVNISGDELKFKGLVRGSADQVEVIESEAFMSSRYLAPLLRQGNSSLIGDFELNKFNALFSVSDKQILAADGRLLFSGGDVSFPLDGKKISATLPILVGVIKKPAENVELVITNTDGQDIGRGYVQPDGWAGIGIRRRFLDILGLQWPAEVDAEKVIFEASQKLL